jgi:hypothetical protein
LFHSDRSDLQGRDPADDVSSQQDDAGGQSLDAYTNLPVPSYELVEGFVGGQFSRFPGRDAPTAHNQYQSSRTSGQ